MAHTVGRVGNSETLKKPPLIPPKEGSRKLAMVSYGVFFDILCYAYNLI